MALLDHLADQSYVERLGRSRPGAGGVHPLGPYRLIKPTVPQADRILVPRQPMVQQGGGVDARPLTTVREALPGAGPEAPALHGGPAFFDWPGPQHP